MDEMKKDVKGFFKGLFKEDKATKFQGKSNVIGTKADEEKRKVCEPTYPTLRQAVGVLHKCNLLGSRSVTQVSHTNVGVLHKWFKLGCRSVTQVSHTRL
jgi:hypothetical protein